MVYKLFVMYITAEYEAPTLITVVRELCVYISLQINILDKMLAPTDFLHWPSLLHF